jgi:hypothetical protein
MPINTSTSTSTEVAVAEPAFSNAERLALAGFLAGYTGLTREAYALDLRQYASWCHQHHVQCQDVRELHDRSHPVDGMTGELSIGAPSQARPRLMAPMGSRFRTTHGRAAMSATADADRRQIRAFSAQGAMHYSVCRTNGEKTYSIPIFATVGPEQSQILRRWSSERGLCDRLNYAG